MIPGRASGAKEKAIHTVSSLTIKYLAKKSIFFSDYDKRWSKLYKTKATIKSFLTISLFFKQSNVFYFYWKVEGLFDDRIFYLPEVQEPWEHKLYYVVANPEIKSAIWTPDELWLGRNMVVFLSKCPTWEATGSQQE